MAVFGRNHVLAKMLEHQLFEFSVVELRVAICQFVEVKNDELIEAALKKCLDVADQIAEMARRCKAVVLEAKSLKPLCLSVVQQAYIKCPGAAIELRIKGDVLACQPEAPGKLSVGGFQVAACIVCAR
ncbi:hypothetical protein D3C81_1399890 [compost metagenome]